MYTTKEIELKINRFNDKVEKYNKKLNEIMGKFDINTKYYIEKSQNSEKKLENLLDSYNSIGNSLKNILDFSFDELNEKIDDIKYNIDFNVKEEKYIENKDITTNDITNELYNNSFPLADIPLDSNYKNGSNSTIPFYNKVGIKIVTIKKKCTSFSFYYKVSSYTYNIIYLYIDGIYKKIYHNNTSWTQKIISGLSNEEHTITWILYCGYNNGNYYSCIDTIKYTDSDGEHNIIKDDVTNELLYNIIPLADIPLDSNYINGSNSTTPYCNNKVGFKVVTIKKKCTSFSFYYKTNNNGCINIYLYIDGVYKGSYGNTSWTQKIISGLSNEEHTITWILHSESDDYYTCIDTIKYSNNRNDISNIISNYKNINRNIELPYNALKLKIFDSISYGFDKSILIQKEYNIENYPNIIRIKKGSNIKAINFGISYSQFNLSHFKNNIETNEKNISKLVNINFESDPNIIHRYYRGTLFFVNIDNKPEVKSYLMIPDNETFVENQSVGPNLLFKFYHDSDYIYIKPVKIRPYRLDWKVKNNDVEIFDMFDKEYYPNSFVQLYCDSYFYDITGEDTSFIESFDNLSISEIENSELEIKPLKDGFYKYIGFNPDNTEKVINSETKKYSFFSHEITESINDPSIFSNIKQENFYEFFDYIYDEYSDVKINDILIKDGDIYIATNVGIFKKDISLNQYIDITKEWDIDDKNFLFIKNDENNNLITFTKTYGIITGNRNYFNLKPTIRIKLFESLLSDTDIIEMSYIYSIKSCVFYTKKGIYLLTKNYSEYTLLKNIESISVLKDIDRLKVINDLVIFIADNYIYTYNYMTLEEKEFDVSSKLLESDIPQDFFINQKVYHLSYINSSNELHVLKLNENNNFEDKLISNTAVKTISILNHPKINNLIITQIKNSKIEVYFDTTLDDYLNDKSDNKFITDYEDTILKNYYTLPQKRYFSINNNNGDYIEYINGFGYKCISNRYNKTKDISDIKKEIINILDKEKYQRSIINNEPVSVPYKIKVYAKEYMDSEKNENYFDSVYEEIGIFNGKQEDLSVDDDKYNFYFTGIGMFAVNKQDNTNVYWTSNNRNNVSSIIKNDIRTVRMNKCIFKMGFNRPCDYDLNDSNTFTVFYGNDLKLYGLGYNINKILDPNKKEDRFISYPKLLDIDKKINYNKVILYKNKLNYIDDRTKTSYIENEYSTDIKYRNILLKYENDNYSISLDNSVENKFMFKDKDNNYYIVKLADNKLVFKNIKNDTEFTLDLSENINNKSTNYNIKEIVSHNINTILVKDTENNLWIFGHIDGFLPCVLYTDKFIKVKNEYLLGDNIKNIYTNQYRTFILTENDLYVSGDVNYYSLKDSCYYSLGLGTKDNINVNYFERVNLSFKVSKIKDIKLTNLCTFILLKDGSLYASGINIEGELGFSDKNIICSEFTKIKDSVNNIWCGIDNIFISVIEDDKENIYATGNNVAGKLGVNIKEDNIYNFTKIDSISNLNDITVNKIYCFDNFTFMVMSDNSIYRCGLNSDYQLGALSRYNIYSAKKLELNSDNKIIDIKTNENNTIVTLTDELGNLYISGKNITKIPDNTVNDKTYTGHLVNFYKKGFVLNSNKIKLYDISFMEDKILCFLKDDEKYYIDTL